MSKMCRCCAPLREAWAMSRAGLCEDCSAGCIWVPEDRGFMRGKRCPRVEQGQRAGARGGRAPRKPRPE